MFLKLGTFFQKEIWRVRLEEVSKGRAFWIRGCRILLLTIEGFTKKQVQMGASALTYYTLLATVPLVALFLGIARGFLVEGSVKELLLEHFSEQEVVVRKIIEFAEISLKQTGEGVFAAVGLLILLWSAFKILRSIEVALNQIWEVKRGRSFARQLSDYFALIVIGPLLVISSTAITVYLSTKIAFLREIAPHLTFLPYVLTWILMTFLYIFMPNTRVRFKAALFAGVITGTLYQLVQWGYLYFQIGVTRHSAIYGTFAALPLFLIWVQLSWVIVLLGGKIAFAFQNVDAYEFISEKEHLSHKSRMLLSLRIAREYIKDFYLGQPPRTLVELSNVLAIPLPLASRLTHALVEGEVLSEVKREKDEESVFQPARSIDQLTINRVIDMIETIGEEYPSPVAPEVEKLEKALESLNETADTSQANLLLKEV